MDTTPPSVEAWILELDVVARAATESVASHGGRLVRVTVAAPPEVAGDRLVPQLQRRLAEFGIDFVDVTVEAGAGPMRLVACDYEPGEPA